MVFEGTIPQVVPSIRDGTELRFSARFPAAALVGSASWPRCPRSSSHFCSASPAANQESSCSSARTRSARGTCAQSSRIRLRCRRHPCHNSDTDRRPRCLMNPLESRAPSHPLVEPLDDWVLVQPTMEEEAVGRIVLPANMTEGRLERSIVLAIGSGGQRPAARRRRARDLGQDGGAARRLQARSAAARRRPRSRVTLRYDGWEIDLLDCGSLDLPAEALGPGFDDPTPTPVFASLWRGHGRTALVDAGSGAFDELWPGGAGLPAALGAPASSPARSPTSCSRISTSTTPAASLAGTLPDSFAPAFGSTPVRVLDVDLDFWDTAEGGPLMIGPRVLRTLRDAGVLETFADGARGAAGRARPFGARALHRALRPGGRRRRRRAAPPRRRHPPPAARRAPRVGCALRPAARGARSRRASRLLAEAEARGAVVRRIAHRRARPHRASRRPRDLGRPQPLIVRFCRIDVGWIVQ